MRVTICSNGGETSVEIQADTQITSIAAIQEAYKALKPLAEKKKKPVIKNASKKKPRR